ncbi:MAG: sugar transferase [Verrucomicrobiota bacterium]|nr:sugar transferase [Verrucomicrobiota bacterium]
MLRHDRKIRTQIHQLLDACLFAMAFWVAFELRTNEEVMRWFGLQPFGTFQGFLWLYLAAVTTSPLVLQSQGYYNRLFLAPRRVTFWPLLKGCGLVTMGLVLTLYALHLNVARLVMIWFGIISFVMVFAKEELLRLAFQSKFAQAQYRRRFVLVGAGHELTRLRRQLKERGDEGVEVVAEANLSDTSVEKLVQTLHELSVYGVIVSAKHAYFERVENVIKACELEGVEAWLIADFFGTHIARATSDELFGHPLLVFRSTPEASWQGLAKMLLDFFGALALLVLLTVIPVIPLIALLIKITSPGPVLFKQRRAGQNGAPFTLYKFRTMITNAEQSKQELEALNEMQGPVFKLTNDPRVTRIGHWLRRYSLDELPQLYNVLRGEMSLVGPRPLPLDEVRRFDDLAHRRRLSVKPGLTCLWQISGRNQITDFKEWVRLDLEYIDHWSLWLDLRILLRTIPIVFSGTGAK